MNILLVVISVVMLIATMTYSRIDRFIAFSSLRIQYEEFMKNDERRWGNERELKNFLKNKREGQKKNQPLDSISKLNISPLLKISQEKVQENLEIQFIRTVLGRLIENLYGKLPFYRSVTEKVPSIPDAVIDQIIQQSKESLCEAPLNKIDQLARIEFFDPDMREMYVKMLKGSDAYPSLLRFLTLKKKEMTKIRLFLAEYPLLVAIFNNPGTARAFRMQRNEIWQRMRQGVISVEDGEYELKSQFEGMVDVDASYLDFKPSKTRPP